MQKHWTQDPYARPLTVKSALWWSYKMWSEIAAKKLERKPLWARDAFDAGCPACELGYQGKTLEEIMVTTDYYCPLNPVWQSTEHCNRNNSVPCMEPETLFSAHTANNNAAQKIAEGALELLKQHCYGTREIGAKHAHN